MPPSLFFEVVLPLLEVDKTSMLAISTPSPEGNMNFYTTMMDSKDPNTGKPMFKVLKVGLACDACQAAGIASECTHSKYCINISVTTLTRALTSLFPVSLHRSGVVPPAVEERQQVRHGQADLLDAEGHVRARVDG